jgi:hypothetical protein
VSQETKKKATSTHQRPLGNCAPYGKTSVPLVVTWWLINFNGMIRHPLRPFPRRRRGPVCCLPGALCLEGWQASWWWSRHHSPWGQRVLSASFPLSGFESTIPGGPSLPPRQLASPRRALPPTRAGLARWPRLPVGALSRMRRS